MRVTPRHPLLLITAVAILPLALVGCGLEDTDADQAAAEDAVAKARERVENYLDAMMAKDPSVGREQFCPVLHPSFEEAATGPNGDFADHFTVTEVAITDVRPNDGRQEVSAAVTVNASGQEGVINLRFAVAKEGDRWCIADEQPTKPTATPTAAP
ncbi:MAG TPA: hypothetical protein VFX60_18725 [Micromonospora sp.]|nr:hypothetical protein [Micromonospora sp.]